MNRDIYLSLPTDWLADIEQRANQQQLTQQEWLYIEIAKLLGKPDPRSTIELTKRVAALEEQTASIPQIEQQLKTLISLVQRLESDRSATPPAASHTATSHTASPPITSMASSFYEQDEDEPDEILYDFQE